MKKILIGFIAGIILSSGIVYAASYYAKDISYEKENWEVSNVSDALNDLKNKADELVAGDATADDIMENKTAVVQGKLVTGTKKDLNGNVSSTASYYYTDSDIVYLNQTITYNIANMGYTKAKISMSSSSAYSSSASTNNGTIASTEWGGSGVNGTYDITGATSLTLYTYSDHRTNKKAIPTISVSFS